jgi:L-ribulokinase
MIMGTSICHMVNGTRLVRVPGMCGVVEDGMIPGCFGYEAGQCGGGDVFAWFVEHAAPPEYHEAARRAGVNLHKHLENEAARQKPGEHGLLALDWWNGNRSTLVDADTSGLLVGATLATRAPDIYRALIEAVAFGTREIIDGFQRHGVPVRTLVAGGGLPERNPLLMQIFADVTEREIGLMRSPQACAVGAAIHGAVAAGPVAGGYADVFAAARGMGGRKETVYRPNREHAKVYRLLYADYRRLYDCFGRGENDVMKRLKALRLSIRSNAAALRLPKDRRKAGG